MQRERLLWSSPPHQVLCLVGCSWPCLWVTSSPRRSSHSSTLSPFHGTAAFASSSPVPLATAASYLSCESTTHTHFLLSTLYDDRPRTHFPTPHQTPPPHRPPETKRSVFKLHFASGLFGQIKCSPAIDFPTPALHNPKATSHAFLRVALLPRRRQAREPDGGIYRERQRLM